MTRIVVDTNVLVSALLNPSGPPAQILLQAINRSVQLCISGSVCPEYEEVISRPKFALVPDVAAKALHSINKVSLWVRPELTIRACPDPSDDIFLECAQASEADYLITGNLKHFPTAWHRTVILTPRAFWELLNT